MHFTHLTQEERYQIQLGIEAGLTKAAIARRIGRDRSTVYRELSRGGIDPCGYQAEPAQQAAERRARRSAANHPTKTAMLWRQVRRYLRREWSPEQLQGWLQRFGQGSVSVPAIYAYVRRVGGRLRQHLRYGRRRYRRGYHPHHLPKDRPSIHQRPAHVADRRQLGHWEGDTFVGGPHHTLALVERSSRFLVLSNPRFSSAPHIARATVSALRNKLVRSITFDNGAQFARYETIRSSLGCAVYFADPYQPNQRATCENTIGLVRQYIPKGSSARHLTNAQLQRIADKINDRPRKCLGFRTPREVLSTRTPVAVRT